ncbi:hypothetical protein D9M72_282420 [compost metagenome]
MGFGLGRPAQGESGPDHGAHLRLWPDRPLQGPSRLCRDCGIDGRAALCQRLPRPAAGAFRRQHRRHAGIAVRRHRRAAGHASPAQPRRRGAVCGRGLVRVGLCRDGEPGAGVRQVRPCARAHRLQPAWYLAIQHIPLPGRAVRDHRRQRRRHLPALHGRDRPRRPGPGSAPGAQRRPCAAQRHARRCHRRMDLRARPRHRAGDAGSRRGAVRTHLYRRGYL